MANTIPAGTPQSLKLVGANQFSSKDAGTTLNLTYEYQFQEKFLLINVARKTKDGTDTIVGFRVQPLPVSLETQNRFTLSDKSVLQYIVLAAAIVAAIFTLWPYSYSAHPRLRPTLAHGSFPSRYPWVPRSF
jgi:hypothetical protein